MFELLGQFDVTSGGFGALAAAAPALLEYLRSRQASEDRIRYLQTRLRDIESQLAVARKALGNRRVMTDAQLMDEMRRRVLKARSKPAEKPKADKPADLEEMLRELRYKALEAEKGKPFDLEAALRALIQELDKTSSR